MDNYFWQGKSVRLRHVEARDWELFARWDLDSEVSRRSYFIPFPRSEEDTKRWAENEAARRPDNDVFRWMIETLSGEAVGTINTYACEPRHGTFEYGIAIPREHHRKGYASEAIGLVLRYFFEELRYQKVNVHVYAFNEPSIRLHESLGFKLEGGLRRMIYTEGQYHDDLIFGLTAEEFADRQGQAL